MNSNLLLKKYAKSASTSNPRIQGLFHAFNVQYGFLLENLPDDPAVVDLGCGDGHLLNWLLNVRGYQNTCGVDASEIQLQKAKENGIPPDRLVSAEILDFLQKKKSRTYDLIFMRDVLEHFSRKDIIKILLKCKERLSEQGKLIIQSPNALFPVFSRVRYGDFTHRICFHSSTFRQLGEMTGFASVDCFSVREDKYSLRRLLSPLRLRESLRYILRAIYLRFYRWKIQLLVKEESPIISMNIIALFQK